MRRIQVCLTAVLLGCGAQEAGPPKITPEQRQAIKRNLAPLKARVTADSPDGLYLSLRNTHVQILEFCGVIEATPRTRADLQDFASVSQAIAKPFLDASELETFKQQLQTTFSPSGSATHRSEFGNLTVAINRKPLRLVLSPKRISPEPTR